MKEKNKTTEPLMFIDTVQQIKNKNESQNYYDSRNKKKQKTDNNQHLEEYPSG